MSVPFRISSGYPENLSVYESRALDPFLSLYCYLRGRGSGMEIPKPGPINFRGSVSGTEGFEGTHVFSDLGVSKLATGRIGALPIGLAI